MEGSEVVDVMMGHSDEHERKGKGGGGRRDVDDGR